MDGLKKTPRRWGEEERRVVNTFVRYLESQGWVVDTEVNYLDVLARREGEELRAEAKSDTKENSGLDIDTMFGQLLRRMGEEVDPSVRYAVVVPPSCVRKVERVPQRILDLLRIEIISVDPDTNEVLAVPLRPTRAVPAE